MTLPTSAYKVAHASIREDRALLSGTTADSRIRRAWVRRRFRSRSWRRTAAFYGFVSPWLIGLVLLGVIPLILGFLTSLTDYDGLNLATTDYVGLRNYGRALADPDARYAFGRTLLWGALNTSIWIILSFTLALILYQDIRSRGLFRTLCYLPSIVPVVGTVWIWKILLHKNFGLVNGLISLFRPGTAIPWLSGWALPSLIVIAGWSGLGWGMTVFLAGLQDIPDELVEAARIDGAATRQVFRHVTVPLMTPVIFFVLVNGLIGSFQQPAIPVLLSATGTGSGYATPKPIYLYMVHT